MREDMGGVGCYNPRSPCPQRAMRTDFEQADVGAKRSSRRSKLSSNCRAAFPGHLRTRNANACLRVPGWVLVVRPFPLLDFGAYSFSLEVDSEKQVGFAITIRQKCFDCSLCNFAKCIEG